MEYVTKLVKSCYAEFLKNMFLYSKDMNATDTQVLGGKNQSVKMYIHS